MNATTSVNRLLRLADLLRSIPNRAFDMTCWIRNQEEQLEEIDHHKHSYTKTPGCGMAACIGGWATHIAPELVLRRGELCNKKTRTVDHVAFSDSFGIDDMTAYRLTNADAPWTTPKQAAREVERVARNLAKENNLVIVIE